MIATPVRSLLLADDDEDDRDLFYEALADLDPAVTYRSAENGEKALQILSTNHTQLPSIIFLDINMPVMNGWEVLRELKTDTRYHHIPVIVYTTSSGAKEKRIAAELGALCFVTKPDKFGHVKNMLEVVIGHVREDKVTELTCKEIHRVLGI